jgi:type IX secretion system PorP/SprF family membrane protein
MIKVLQLFFQIFFMILLFSPSYGQDMIYTQFYNAPIYFNPAATGADQGLRINTLDRILWPRSPSHWNSYNFEGDYGVRNIPGVGGFGLFVNIENEGSGFIRSYQTGLSFSTRINISSHVAAQIGIKGSVILKKVDWNKLIFSDQISELYGNIYESTFQHPESNSRTLADFGIGCLFQYSNKRGNFSGNSGFAVDHIFEPDEAFLSTASSRIPRKYVLHSDFMIYLKDGSAGLFSYGFKDPFALNPGFIFVTQNVDRSLIQVGLNMIKCNVHLGFWYRYMSGDYSQPQYSFVVGYRVYFSKTSMMRIMYNMDLSKPSFGDSPVYAHEFCLSFNFKGIGAKGVKKTSNEN